MCTAYAAGSPAQPPFTSSPLKILHHHSRAVTGLALVSPSGHVVSCGLDGKMVVWNYVNGEVLRTFEHKNMEFRCLAVRYDTGEVVLGTTDSHLIRCRLTPTAEHQHQLRD